MFELERWEVTWAHQRETFETITSVRKKSHHRFFDTEAAATEFKNGRQQAGCVASIRPVYRSVEERQRHFQRCQVELTGTEAWPPQARKTTR
jgi:hypothetical protein